MEKTNNVNLGELKIIPLSKIVVGKRFREDFGDLNELEESILKEGLISPLTVKKIPSTDKFHLLAGERRYRVLVKNKISEVSVRIYSENISHLEMRSIEMSENLHRKNFEYFEQDKIIAEIHKLKVATYGKKYSGNSKEGWGLKETGEFINSSKASVHIAIQRNKMRDAFPGSFSKCKNQKEANQVIAKIDEEITKTKLVEKIKAKKLPDNKKQILDKIINSYIIEDTFKGIKKIPSGVFQFVEIDPPYGVNLKGVMRNTGLSSKSKFNLSEYNEINEDIYIKGDGKGWLGTDFLFEQCYRVMAKNSWLICWFAQEPFTELIFQSIKRAGFSVKHICGIWNKANNQSPTCRPEYNLGNNYEVFYYAKKGNPVLNKAGRSNMFEFKRTSPAEKIHPTERPIPLMREIYSTFCFPGSKILIPFLGSGSGIISAIKENLNPIGFEISDKYKKNFIINVNKELF